MLVTVKPATLKKSTQMITGLELAVDFKMDSQKLSWFQQALQWLVKFLFCLFHRDTNRKTFSETISIDFMHDLGSTSAEIEKVGQG